VFTLLQEKIHQRISNKAVFLDRDGVITQDSPCYVYRSEQLILIAKSAEAIRLLNENGFKVVVVSNQSGVARGYFTEEDVEQFNYLLLNRLREKEAYIDAIYYCPHHPDAVMREYRMDCDCRKPKPGMILKAALELNINLKKSFMIGDKWSDIEAGRRAGCKAMLVETGHGKNELKKYRIEPTCIASNLYGAVKKIF
jgi:D,D-heptose 1,7-bisphosphate phosphatase